MKCTDPGCKACVMIGMRRFTEDERVLRMADGVGGTVAWLGYCGLQAGIAWDTRPNTLEWHWVDSPVLKRRHGPQPEATR